MGFDGAVKIMTKVFISHSSLDNAPAREMKNWLELQGFEHTFLDFDEAAGIRPGADWERTLYREIEKSEAVILILTPNWQKSRWCFAEYAQARALGKAVFPVIETVTDDELIARDVQHLDLTVDREVGLEQLSRALREVRESSPFPWDSSRAPYPGLLSFQESDAAIFFGRRDDTWRLIEHLNARRVHCGQKLTALTGSSGSGKSSLLRAGVAPRLKRDGENWIVLPAFRPQKNPIDELARALAAGLGEPDSWRTIRDRLAAGPTEKVLAEIAENIKVRARASDASILVSIDQFEEVFGTSDPEEAERFYGILNGLIESGPAYIVACTLRSDFIGEAQSVRLLARRLETVLLGPMPMENVAEIVLEPARVAGLRVQEGVAIAAARDAASADALPLLAFTLRALYDRFGSSGELTLEDYRSLGDKNGALSPLENAVRQAADDVLSTMEPSDEELAGLRDSFVPAMVYLTGSGEYARQPADWNELPETAHRLLEALVSKRLLVRRVENEVQIVEVAHEALLRIWPRLALWLEQEREFLSWLPRATRDAEEWWNLPPDVRPTALLKGFALQQAREWLRVNETKIPRKAVLYIKNSSDVDLVARQHRDVQEEFKKYAVPTFAITAALVPLGFILYYTAGPIWAVINLHDESIQCLERENDNMRDVFASISEEIEISRRNAVKVEEYAVPYQGTHPCLMLNSEKEPN